jgi:phenylpropionate dioxygenase-like ring-hydroxylating dioxygenase large terminal subunit
MNAQDYCQGEAFHAEKRAIFSNEWLPACAEGQIATPGAFLAATVGGWSLVAVRGGDQAVRVLRNNCRHQNMPVVGVPAGQCETFRCRFHGWTYDLAGKFLSAPAQVAPADPHSPQVDLVPFAVVCEAGMVFFNLVGNAPPPRIGDLPAYAGTIATEIACNWKTCVEHLLGEQDEGSPDFTWHWPLLTVRRADDTTIVEQVVPHTFLRTRLLTHVFGGSAGVQEAAPSIKQACERLQADRAAGRMSEGAGTLLADFHRRLDVVSADRPAAT